MHLLPVPRFTFRVLVCMHMGIYNVCIYVFLGKSVGPFLIKKYQLRICTEKWIRRHCYKGSFSFIRAVLCAFNFKVITKRTNISYKNCMLNSIPLKTLQKSSNENFTHSNKSWKHHIMYFLAFSLYLFSEVYSRLSTGFFIWGRIPLFHVN